MALTWVAKNDYLSQSEMENNAKIFYNRMTSYGFTLQAISAMLGNIQAESGINPGIWESLEPYEGGYGLVQWTPYTKYSEWAGSNWQNNGDKQCERINYEFNNGLQWSTDYEYAVDMTSTEFKVSTDSVSSLAIAFLWNYENPNVEDAEAKLEKEQQRSANAQSWYTFLQAQAYVPRLEMGNIYNSPYYTTWDIYYPEYKMPNCTAYAFGRWNELTDTQERHSRFPTGQGCDWYPQGIAKGFAGGMVPQLGAAACWWYEGEEDGQIVPTGHVAIVEQINYDSNGNPVSFVTSNSAWWRDGEGGIGTPTNDWPYFYLNTISMDNLDDPWGTHPEGYFQGFLYNENISPVPPVPPTPTHRKMPFIFYLKRQL